MKRASKVYIMASILLLSVVLIGLVIQPPTKASLVLATTTSTQDSGLLDYILPDFESRYNVKVYVVAVGSGTALAYGKNGDADVLMVHDPENEKKFVADGYGTNRTEFMYNRFIIVGPAEDPAGIKSSGNATQAFEKLYFNGTEGKVKFLSRGDKSGTNSKELKLWGLLDLNASEFSSSWYESVGKGMGDTLSMCEEKNAYTLADEATFYSLLATGKIPHIQLMYQGDELLFNQYSVILVNSQLWPKVNYTLGEEFLSWITSPMLQEMISAFTDPSGHHLFTPNVGVSSKASSIVYDLYARTRSSGSSYDPF